MEYHITDSDADFVTNERFITEVLHPTLQKSFSADFPFSVDAALSEEVAEKGKKLQFVLWFSRGRYREEIERNDTRKNL